MKAASGCFASLAWFSLVAMAMASVMMGDCVPGFGHDCPTDHERNMRLLLILFVGIAVYIAAAWLLEKAGRHRD